MLTPMPAGTKTGRPSTRTSRWACTWNVRLSLGSGFKPAFTVSASGWSGAGQTTSPGAGGVGVASDTEPQAPRIVTISAATRTEGPARSVITGPNYCERFGLASVRASGGAPALGASAEGQSAGGGCKAHYMRRTLTWPSTPAFTT